MSGPLRPGAAPLGRVRWRGGQLFTFHALYRSLRPHDGVEQAVPLLVLLSNFIHQPQPKIGLVTAPNHADGKITVDAAFHVSRHILGVFAHQVKTRMWLKSKP